ncbi:3-isopropylmalate dehydratase small subunit [Candidimonas nitroreducens]|uniref:3-isopropylmalate dehydratase n=1 Tax=Candidimonas nitroreducens TaxID=683354 RepID=A0A225ML70_9BURK|nr:3-isopropylmalate dehydratase [Candidimonas nitroreducens]OWT62076.1 3-isopropylmalate dehydratase [Candidimonas nitroreducens]
MGTFEGWKTRGRCHVLGDDIPHDGAVMPFDLVTAKVRDPELLISHLFEAVDPGLRARLQPGDFIVAGRNFLCGKAHNQGLIALKALQIRILCESMPFRSFRGAIGLALPCLVGCTGITGFLKDGDEIEADLETGEVIRLAAGESKNYPPISPTVKAIVEEGGMRGMLAKWLEDHPERRLPA